MKIAELVPPLELCKQIPAGEFEDSALVWLNIQYPTIPWKVVERRISRYKMERNKKSFPAPTLQEILEVLPHDDAYNTLILSWSEKIEKFTGWHIYYIGDRKRHCYDQSAVTAALKLWLKMKGIENE